MKTDRRSTVDSKWNDVYPSSDNAPGWHCRHLAELPRNDIKGLSSRLTSKALRVTTRSIEINSFSSGRRQL